MDVDIAAIGVFVAIAAVISLTIWTDHRDATAKRQRLEKIRRHI